MTERLSATKISLAILLAFAALGSGIRINRLIKYEAPLNQIRERITLGQQLSEEEKREYLGILHNINFRNPSKELENFMHLSLPEKRNELCHPSPRHALDYLHQKGIIDKNNLSHGECVYLEQISLTMAKGMLFSN